MAEAVRLDLATLMKKAEREKGSPPSMKKMDQRQLHREPETHLERRLKRIHRQLSEAAKCAPKGASPPPRPAAAWARLAAQGDVPVDSASTTGEMLKAVDRAVASAAEKRQREAKK